MVCVRGVTRGHRAVRFCKPGTATPHKKFTGEAVCPLLRKRAVVSTPFFSGYRPHSSTSRTTDATGDIYRASTDANGGKGRDGWRPGDHITAGCELIHPIALEQGLKFATARVAYTVGDGRVSTVIE